MRKSGFGYKRQSTGVLGQDDYSTPSGLMCMENYYLEWCQPFGFWRDPIDAKNTNNTNESTGYGSKDNPHT